MRQEKKVDCRKKRIKRLSCLFFLLAFLVAGYFVYRSYQNDKEQEVRFDQLEEIEEERDLHPVSRILPEEEKNSDWIGWLKIKDTSISYPIMQRKGDGEYYLHRDFDGSDSFYGTPFLDFRCTIDSDNCIIYGHNINGGKMFGALHAYSSESYYKEHPYIQFDTIYEKGTYQVMYVFRSKVYSEEDVTFKYYQFINAASEMEFNSYLNEMAALSLYDTGVTAAYGDKLLTLSTCDYQEKKGRFVVVAKKIG